MKTSNEKMLQSYKISCSSKLLGTVGRIYYLESSTIQNIFILCTNTKGERNSRMLGYNSAINY